MRVRPDSDVEVDFESDMLFDWDYRPAVRLRDGRTFAITRDGGDWELLAEISARDVFDTGLLLSEREFADSFPDAELSKIPDRSLSKCLCARLTIRAAIS